MDCCRNSRYFVFFCLIVLLHVFTLSLIFLCVCDYLLLMLHAVVYPVSSGPIHLLFIFRILLWFLKLSCLSLVVDPVFCCCSIEFIKYNSNCLAYIKIQIHIWKKSYNIKSYVFKNIWLFWMNISLSSWTIVEIIHHNFLF